MPADLDDVDWVTLRHAYGPAGDVPDLLRGLTSADPDEREIALDGLHATVHHQGDVYDATLACVPFLVRIVADDRVSDRAGVLELLGSIAGSGYPDDPLDEDDAFDDDELDEESEDLRTLARHTVSAELDLLVRLLAADDPAVRGVAAHVVAALHPDRGVALGLLRRCTGVETDPSAAVAMLRASGRIATADPRAAEPAAPWHRELLASGAAAVVRLAALGALARYAPQDLPSPLAGRVAELMASVRADPQLRAGSGDDRSATTTLRGTLRAEAAERTAGGLPQWVLRGAVTLHRALGDRVDDRIALVLDGLASPDRSERLDSVYRASVLVSGWRGEFGPVVRQVALALHSDDERLADTAASALERWYPLTAPVADDLAAHLAAGPGRGVKDWGTGPPGLTDAAAALAELRDPRALPAVRALLERGSATGALGRALVRLGDVAAPLGPEILRALDRAAQDAAPDRTTVESLLRGAGALRLAAAAPAVVTLVSGGALGRPWIVGVAVAALAAMGPAADTAGPLLADLARSDDADLAVAAARAHRTVTGSAEIAVPALLRLVADRHHRGAISALGATRDARPEVVATLRELLAHDDTRVAAGLALARLNAAGPGVPEQLTPELLATWEQRPLLRPFVSEALTDLGPLPEVFVAPLRAELASPRRHGNIGGPTGSANSDVGNDEQLLKQCRALLTTRA